MGSCSLSVQVRGAGVVTLLWRSWGLACNGCASSTIYWSPFGASSVLNPRTSEQNNLDCLGHGEGASIGPRSLGKVWEEVAAVVGYLDRKEELVFCAEVWSRQNGEDIGLS